MACASRATCNRTAVSRRNWTLESMIAGGRSESGEITR
jgi:hypothetical protein